ncbi:F0F1 ATP synthase subunit epsilon [Patescibacteria group bacterium]|jgi:F-type H+-transporting ATPase subunit epsilon|nr:F0F1 ATP synthase subunit epsilon [Patescibacteria group bacterium]
MSFHLLIQTPEREAYKGDADILTLSNDTGEMQVFPGHASMLGSITYSAVKVDHAQHEEAFVLRQGFVFVDQEKNEVKVLGLSCEKTADLDMVSAKEYLDFILSKLDKPDELNEYQLKFLEGQKLAVEKQLGS